MKNIYTLFLMFRQLLQILSKKQKRQGMILFFILICTSVLEMLGISVVIPFIMAMLEPDVILDNRYMKLLTQHWSMQPQQIVYFMAFCIVLVYFIKNAAILVANYYQTNFRNTLEKDLSVKMLVSYMKRPYSFFLDTNSAEIMRGINGDIISVAAVLDDFFVLFAEGITCFFISTFLVCLSPFIAVFLLLTALLTALFIVLVFKKKIGKCGVETRKAFAQKYQYAYQAVTGIKEITVMQRRDSFAGQYEKAAERARKNNNTYLFISKVPSRLIETIFLCALVILVCANLKMFETGADYVSVLGALAVAAVRILPSISSIANAVNSLVYNRSAMEASYVNIKEAEKYDALIASRKKEKEDRQDATLSFKRLLQIDQISWRYKPELPYVLKNLSLEIYKGEAIAFIGESGAGKTTLADIILGLFQPEEGKILLDGNDIFNDLPRWAKIIGYVPQSVFLLDDTVRNNVVFGIPEEEIDETKVWQTLEQAQLKDTVQKLEKGLDTVLGERGVKLSGGQRQRIAIARALYYNPDILVLDEATSALDTETESAVMEAINMLQGSKTLIIVAHRLTTIRNCDRIYEIKQGRAVEVKKDILFRE